MKEDTYSKDWEVVVRERWGGKVITLGLHKRLTLPRNAPKPFWTLSWRSTLADGHTNRRLYKSQGEFWEIPIKIASEMLNQMHQSGGLDGKYDGRWNDQVVKKHTIVYSGPPESEPFFSKILAIKPEDEHMWKSSEFRAVVFKEPENQWNPKRECWKIMLGDIQRQMLTFRTIANNEDYGMKIYNLPHSHKGWFMDNAMMDADPCIMGCFRKALVGWKK